MTWAREPPEGWLEDMAVARKSGSHCPVVPVKPVGPCCPCCPCCPCRGARGARAPMPVLRECSWRPCADCVFCNGMPVRARCRWGCRLPRHVLHVPSQRRLRHNQKPGHHQKRLFQSSTGTSFRSWKWGRRAAGINLLK